MEVYGLLQDIASLLDYVKFAEKLVTDAVKSIYLDDSINPVRFWIVLHPYSPSTRRAVFDAEYDLRRTLLSEIGSRLDFRVIDLGQEHSAKSLKVVFSRGDR